MYVFRDTLHVGDRVIATLDEKEWDDDKVCYLYPAQLPTYAALIFNWGDGTPNANIDLTWGATHAYQTLDSFSLIRRNRTP